MTQPSKLDRKAIASLNKRHLPEKKKLLNAARKASK